MNNYWHFVFTSAWAWTLMHDKQVRCLLVTALDLLFLSLLNTSSGIIVKELSLILAPLLCSLSLPFSLLYTRFSSNAVYRLIKYQVPNPLFTHTQNRKHFKYCLYLLEFFSFSWNLKMQRKIIDNVDVMKLTTEGLTLKFL